MSCAVKYIEYIYRFRKQKGIVQFHSKSNMKEEDFTVKWLFYSFSSLFCRLVDSSRQSIFWHAHSWICVSTSPILLPKPIHAESYSGTLSFFHVPFEFIRSVALYACDDWKIRFRDYGQSIVTHNKSPLFIACEVAFVDSCGPFRKTLGLFGPLYSK